MGQPRFANELLPQRNEIYCKCLLIIYPSTPIGPGTMVQPMSLFVPGSAGCSPTGGLGLLVGEVEKKDWTDVGWSHMQEQRV